MRRWAIAPAAVVVLAGALELGLPRGGDACRAISPLRLAWGYARAFAGSAAAAFVPGYARLRGCVLPQDVSAGLAWLRVAAGAGHAEAQYWAAEALASGHAGAPDRLRAAQLYGLSAAQDFGLARLALSTGAARNEPEMLHQLARLRLEGRGFPRDDGEAARLMRAAAAAGSGTAAADLGLMHARGRAVPYGAEEALRWYRVAAERGDPLGLYLLGDALFGRADRSDARDAWREAIERARPGAARGVAEDQYVLGLAHADFGAYAGLAFDAARGEALLLGAARQGHVEAAAALARLYLDPSARVQGDPLPWLERAAAALHPDSCYRLAERLAAADGTQPRRFALYRCAADQRHAAAAARVAAHHAEAVAPVARDLGEAVRWYEAAIAYGEVDANLPLATILLRGDGVPRDVDAALARLRAYVDRRLPDAAHFAAVARVIAESDLTGPPLDAARRAIEQAIAMDVRSYGRGNLYRVGTYGQVLLRQGELVRAEQVLREALAQVTIAQDRLCCQVLLGDVLRAQGRQAEARAQWEQALAIAQGTMLEAGIRRRLGP